MDFGPSGGCRHVPLQRALDRRVRLPRHEEAPVPREGDGLVLDAGQVEEGALGRDDDAVPLAPDVQDGHAAVVRAVVELVEEGGAGEDLARAGEDGRGGGGPRAVVGHAQAAEARDAGRALQELHVPARDEAPHAVAHQRDALGALHGAHLLHLAGQVARGDTQVVEREAGERGEVDVEAVALQEPLPRVPVDKLLPEGAGEEDDRGPVRHGRCILAPSSRMRASATRKAKSVMAEGRDRGACARSLPSRACCSSLPPSPRRVPWTWGPPWSSAPRPCRTPPTASWAPRPPSPSRPRPTGRGTSSWTRSRSRPSTCRARRASPPASRARSAGLT